MCLIIRDNLVYEKDIMGLRTGFWESQDPVSKEHYAIVCIVLGKLFTFSKTKKTLQNLSFFIYKVGPITSSTSRGIFFNLVQESTL